MRTIERASIGGRTIDVCLPPSYFTSGKRYPVVYVMGGGELVKHCENHLHRLFLEGWLPELILAGVEAFDGHYRACVDELAGRIKPYVDENYRTVADGARTAIVGSAGGGLIPLYAAHLRPDAFGLIGALSPSLGDEGAMGFLREQSAVPEPLRIFLSVGAQEGIAERDARRNAAMYALELRRRWQSQGLGEDRLAFELEEDGTHDTMFIARYFPQALLWFYGQDAERPPGMTGQGAAEPLRYEIPGTDTYRLRSEHTGLGYCIFVSQPIRSAPAEGYPALYAVDGNAHFGSMAEAMRMQSWHPEGIAPGLIVGIGYESEEPFVYGRRMYDFTVETPESELRSDGMAWPPTGGADSFLLFLEQELLPFIRSRYPVDVSRQSLFGHSLGGLFALYALFDRPSPFRSFVAGSPSIWWNKYHLLSKVPEFEARLGRGAVQAELILAVGSEEEPSMIEDAVQLCRRLKPYENRGLEIACMLIEGEDHLSVIHPMISKVFRQIFRNGRATQNG
ncbi:alpha/beta hydrolase [Cohnella fermenti]|uniref:Alpha/beta hydrolase n=1 Tax=Cohnella fermenti TaxID=2565925 RepID=A0A4S4C205_9BACL|nr:alpha/beta hydrolase-fold protein [Cohnella fermenti]THF81636.1 alpha/beta hydrolase [Cohnella fermenti]